MATNTKKWAGNDSRKARALFEGRLPLPCSKCGRPVTGDQPWHADHLIPRWADGSDDPSNLWPAHKKCNESDGGKRGAAVTNARRPKTVERVASERERGIRGI